MAANERMRTSRRSRARPASDTLRLRPRQHATDEVLERMKERHPPIDDVAGAYGVMSLRSASRARRLGGQPSLG